MADINNDVMPEVDDDEEMNIFARDDEEVYGDTAIQRQP